MNQADAEAHLPPVVLPEVNGEVLPNYERVDHQDLQPGLFYYMGGNGARGEGGGYWGLQRNNYLVEYEGIEGDNYVFTFYKERTKDPLGPWVDDMDQGVDFPIADFQNRNIRLYTYNLAINHENMNMNGGTYKRFKSYKTRRATRKAARKTSKKRGKKTRRHH